ncbi:MAG: hypothetical protein MUF48_14570 [Pirellulaceae bacterium]|jgi:hypothetical protein|nr:hypothetical protein [Pirellulaceae bacterium]
MAVRSRGALAVGFALGLLVGVGMLIGAWTTLAVRPAAMLAIPETALRASATDSGEMFAIATGAIADGVEGVFFLDFLTGSLECWVINGRTRQMGGHFFVPNVGDNLGVIPGQGQKNPRYLMVTGVAPMQRGSGGFQPADSLVYVADANTGNFAIYAIPWNRQATVTNRPQELPMVVLLTGSARNREIRGQ